MKIANYVSSSLAESDAGRFDAALTFACIAIDGTVRRMFPSEKSNRARYIRCLRHYYWIIEPVLGAGIDLEKTRFSNIKLNKVTDPDLAEIVYEVFRCAHAHGDEVPPEFDLVAADESGIAWTFGDDRLHLPRTLLFALLFVVVFAPVNKEESTTDDGYLSLGSPPNMFIFPIKDNWGRAAHLQPIAEKFNKVRVHIIFPPGHSFDPDGPVGTLVIDNRPQF